MCVTSNAFYFSFHNQIVKTDWKGRFLKRVEVVPHGGDICHWNGKVYVGVWEEPAEKGGYKGWFDDEVKSMDLARPQLPPGMPEGGHGGSHGYLTEDFIRAILLKDHKPCVDVVTALDTTIAGVYAHLSAMKDGESLKVPAVS